jgi:hypothetical protein
MFMMSVINAWRRKGELKKCLVVVVAGWIYPGPLV